MSTLRDIEVKYQHNPDVEYINYEYALGSDRKTPIEPWNGRPCSPTAKAPYVLCRVTATYKNGEKEVVWLDAIGKHEDAFAIDKTSKIKEYKSPYPFIEARARGTAKAKYPHMNINAIQLYRCAYTDGYLDAVAFACDWLKEQFPNTHEETRLIEEFVKAMKGE